MTGGCFTRAREVDEGNMVGGRTRGRLASWNNSKIVSSGQVNGGSIKGGSTAIDGIRTMQKLVVPNVTPTTKACLQDCSSRVDGNLVNNGQSKEDEKQIGDHTSKRVECSVSTSEPGLSSRNLPVVPKKNGVEIQSTLSVAVPKIIGVENPSTRPVANSLKKEKSSDHVQALKIEAKSSPVNTSTARNSIKIGSENHHDKSPRTQHRTTTIAPQRKTNEVEKNSHVAESSRNQKTTSFLRRAETSRSGEKRGKQLNYNVVIDKDLLCQRAISEDSDNTLGTSCPLCENDLMSLPPNYEYHDGIEPSNLPEVAVLHCGHAFHSACLEEILPSGHYREPPCHFCISNKD